MAHTIPCSDGTIADADVGCVETPGAVVNPDSSIVELLLQVAGFLSLVIAVVALIGMLWGGIKYASAAGDEEKTAKSKRIIIWSIFGLVVGLLAQYLVRFIVDIL